MEEGNKKTNIILIIIVVLVLVIGFESYIIISKSKDNNNTVENNTGTNSEVEKNDKVVDNKEEKDNKTVEEDTPTEKEENDNEYASLYKEDGNTIIDYDIYTNYNEINFKKVYELVVKESSKLKKAKNINLFDYIGRVNKIGNYYYINYDVYYYNLPKDVYEKNKDQITSDKKLNKLNGCEKDKCNMIITTGYKNISKYLVKKAFYYYVFDGTKKIQTTDILNRNYILSVIPQSWVALGSYKTEYDMFKDCLLMLNENKEYKNYLVIYDTGSEVKIKYKGKSKTIIEKKDYSSNISKLYDINSKVNASSDKSKYVGSYKAVNGYFDEETNELFYYYLDIREDGTYAIGHNSAQGGRNVGTYEIIDDKLLLHDVVSYGSDACYWTDKEFISDKTLYILEDGSLIEEIDGKIYKYIKDSKLKESKEDLLRYITNPVDGKKPYPNDDEWIHCNADGSAANSKNN